MSYLLVGALVLGLIFWGGRPGRFRRFLAHADWRVASAVMSIGVFAAALSPLTETGSVVPQPASATASAPASQAAVRWLRKRGSRRRVDRSARAGASPNAERGRF